MSPCSVENDDETNESFSFVAVFNTKRFNKVTKTFLGPREYHLLVMNITLNQDR